MAPAQRQACGNNARVSFEFSFHLGNRIKTHISTPNAQVVLHLLPCEQSCETKRCLRKALEVPQLTWSRQVEEVGGHAVSRNALLQEKLLQLEQLLSTGVSTSTSPVSLPLDLSSK